MIRLPLKLRFAPMSATPNRLESSCCCKARDPELESVSQTGDGNIPTHSLTSGGRLVIANYLGPRHSSGSSARRDPYVHSHISLKSKRPRAPERCSGPLN